MVRLASRQPRPAVVHQLTPPRGHSVVQRQLWRMENEGMNRQQAYDVTRREFYRMRQEEQIERRLAKEEALHVGAYFGKSRLDVGMLLEDNEYESWKVWAGKEAQKREMAEAAQAEEDEAGGEEADATLRSDQD